MEQYAQYKPSGVDWIGEIPESWSVGRVKHVLKERDERVDDASSDELLSVSEYYGVDYRKNRIRETQVLSRAESLSGYKKCEKNDIVMNIMLAWKGSQARTPFSGVVSPAYAVFKPENDVNTRYLSYLFRTDLYREIFRQNSTGIIDSRLRLYPEVFLHLPFHYPPVNEQVLIADYLDEKTKKIDAAIADVEASIAKLEEYRKSVISEAVTKGLDPTIPMKDSGSDWIGLIPEDWRCGPLGHFVNFLSGFPFKGEDLTAQGEVRVLRGINLGVNNIRWNESAYVAPEVVRSLDEWRLNKGDLLLGLDRPWIKAGTRVSFVSEDDAGSYLVQRIAKITKKQDVSLKFVCYLLQTDLFFQSMNTETTGVSVPHISTRQVGLVYFPIPPLCVQDRIVKYLDEVCGNLAELVSRKNKLLMLLQSYRQSLINECVTGKVKVPGVEG
ncbi:restriction endonuclease subunit S [Bifidobacterium oedipodis]|uniref:Restriction modification system DNA specificity domain-containing protein n=1 Tax=Bifidobacterium oedipodis TaxID=2675322 RepID=A0A7Y0EPX2_9BIFI|nr:restriction endonuclease subunit S [Bifidobacterium sp. DSM 109957]NMM93116.1 restriction modification system DNA specificity domain-containing protein [Bifidobacterium sp. DSM 109957]